MIKSQTVPDSPASAHLLTTPKALVVDLIMKNGIPDVGRKKQSYEAKQKYTYIAQKLQASKLLVMIQQHVEWCRVQPVERNYVVHSPYKCLSCTFNLGRT